MSTNTALYYPYLSISDARLIKHGLFLWDKIEVINPLGFPTHRFDNRDLCEAAELLTVAYEPAADEMQLAHEQIVKLTQQKLPNWMFFRADRLKTPIYNRKFQRETWDLLREKGLVVPAEPDDAHWGSSEDAHWGSNACGLLLMAILADCCAGRLKKPLTDEWQAYAAYSRYITQLNGGSYDLKPATGQDVLAAIPVASLNIDQIPLKNLIKLRKKELDKNGGDYRTLRRGFLKAVEEHVKDISTKQYTSGQLKKVRRGFHETMIDEYEDLGRELGLNGRKTLLSKEMLAVVAGAGTSLLQPVVGGAVMLGGLGRMSTEYHSARRKILRGNPTSYVYLAKHISGLELDLR